MQADWRSLTLLSTYHLHAVSRRDPADPLSASPTHPEAIPAPATKLTDTKSDNNPSARQAAAVATSPFGLPARQKRRPCPRSRPLSHPAAEVTNTYRARKKPSSGLQEPDVCLPAQESNSTERFSVRILLSHSEPILQQALPRPNSLLQANLQTLSMFSCQNDYSLVLIMVHTTARQQHQRGF